MEIEIIGEYADSLSADCIEAALFFQKILIHPNLSRRLKVYIDVQKNREIPGETFVDDNKMREFTLEVERPKFIANIAHEMVHVKQWATGQLETFFYPGYGWIHKWHGDLWFPNRREHAYYDSPWEIEAYGREQGLMHRWTLYKEAKKKNCHSS